MSGGFISELQILELAQQICYRDFRDITSVMLQKFLDGMSEDQKQGYSNRVVFL